MFPIIIPLAWPIFALVLRPFIIPPITKFFGRAKTMSIGNLVLTETEARNAVTERELLKYGILIAASDGKVNEVESELLNRLAYSMANRIDDLNEEEKKKVISAAINTATADKEITIHEYQIIKTVACTGKFKMQLFELHNEIFTWCHQLDMNKEQLPTTDELQIKYEQWLIEKNLSPIFVSPKALI